MRSSYTQSTGLACAGNNFKRTRYFHGQLLTDRDFREEQIYHNEKRKLLNRTLHGWGVVCGLKVKPTDPPSQHVIVEPGLALDCHGNEIMVCEEQTMDLSAALRSLGRGERIFEECAEYKKSSFSLLSSELYVFIRYQESPTDPVPVYAPGGSCEEKTCDYSRTNEGFCIEVWDHPPDLYRIFDPFSELSAESFAPCKEPYPCPSADYCPDPHYILLATISCGARFDALVSNRIIKSGPPAAEIRFWASRTLDKVCLLKDSQVGVSDKITVTGSYEFDTEDIDYQKSIIWTINWNNLPLPEGVSVNKTDEKSEGRKYLVEYEITAETNAATGTADIEIPISSLKYTRKDGSTEIEWVQNELPILKSPIEIGIAEVSQSRAISKALIRNVERRKFVATFPWFAWLYTNMMGERREDEPPWSGDLSVHCAARVPIGLLATRRVTRAEVAKEAAVVREELRKEMLGKIAEAEKKNADALKKVESDYKKKLAEMDKVIKELQEEAKKRK